jgi:hypothetical protein
MASNNNIFKMSNAGGFKTLNRYPDMLAGNTTWNPWSPANDYDSIATVTVGAGGATEAAFTLIPSTYRHLQLRIFSNATTLAGFGLRFNNDSNSAWHFLRGNGTVAAVGASVYQAGDMYAGDTGTSGNFGVQVIDLLDYASTDKFKVMRSLGGYDLNGSGIVSLRSGYWGSTAAISDIKVTSASWLQYSSFALYGVK